jgi:uncharacterized protein (TIGR03437 family)
MIGVVGVPSPTAFQFDHVQVSKGDPGFFVISPSKGVTPTTLTLTLNESAIRRMVPGQSVINLFFSTIDQTPQSTAVIMVDFRLATRIPTIQSINAQVASGLPISPGQIVSISGTYLAPPITETPGYDQFGLYPTKVLGTSVTFNGIAAPVVYASAGRVDAVVPYELAGQTSADVVVTRYTPPIYGSTSDPFTIQLQDTAPALLTTTPDGQGLIFNVPIPADVGGFGYLPRDLVANSLDNPAPAGSTVRIFATGSGVWDPPLDNGEVVGTGHKPAAPVSLTIGGYSARILFAGPSPYDSNLGRFIIDAIVPDGTASGSQPVVLTVGNYDSSSQIATIAIR